MEVDQFNARVCDVTHDDGRYVVVFSAQRERRDTLRRLQLLKKTEDRLRKLEARVDRGELTQGEDIVAAAERILATSPVRSLFTYDAADARFVYDNDHDALDYEESLAGHYVLHTSLHAATTSPATVLACYQSLRQVEDRFCVLKDFLRLRPIFHWTETRVRGHIAVCVLAAVIEALMRNGVSGVTEPKWQEMHPLTRVAGSTHQGRAACGAPHRSRLPS